MADQSEQSGGPSRKSKVVIDLNEYRDAREPMPVTFHRLELNQILRIYGRMVGEGEWRDYAIDHRSNMAVFSVYRRAQEQPTFAITKVMLRGDKDPNYILLAGKRQIKSARRLPDIIELLDRQLNLVD